MMKVEPVTLQGTVVRLEPLRMAHAGALYEAGRDPEIWTYLTYKQPRSLVEMEQHIAAVLGEEQAGARLPFAVINLQSGCAVGETGYHDFLLKDHGLEVGTTWLAPSIQGTGVNTESKYLLLRHAFETMGAIRVQFRTRFANIKAQRAIERLGAVKEGVLRNNFIRPDGSYGDRHVYSIIEREWPSVRVHLEEMLQRKPY
jgi:RimJ/RimL family protein N-acetyltransferase